MSASEQYSAMQQGVVDGAESNEIDYVGKKYYEVAPVFSRTEHCFSTDFVVASTQFLESLSEEDKELVEGVMDECVEKEFDFWAEMVEDSIEQAQSLGIEFIDDVDKELSRRALQNFRNQLQTAMT